MGVTASRASVAKGSSGIRDIKCSHHRLYLEGSIHFTLDLSEVKAKICEGTEILSDTNFTLSGQ